MSSADRTELFRISTGFLRTPVRRYGFAIIAVCVAYGLQRALETAIEFPHSFLLFYLTILIVALLAGFWPGISATALAGLAAAYFYREPATSCSQRRDTACWARFVCTGRGRHQLAREFTSPARQ